MSPLVMRELPGVFGGVSVVGWFAYCCVCVCLYWELLVVRILLVVVPTAKGDDVELGT